MILWIGIAVLLTAAIILVVWPMLRGPRQSVSRTQAEINVYRDQLRELEKEAARGIIGSSEAEAAKLEIQRRILRAADEQTDETNITKRQPVVAGCIGIVIASSAIALYAVLGSPTLPDQPFAARQNQTSLAEARNTDIDARIQSLIENIEANPDDVEALWMLGQTYLATGRFIEATRVLRDALAIDGDNPQYLAAFAEALTLSNENMVLPAARTAFEQVLTQLPSDPRARFYLGLSDAQQGNYQSALDRWLALYRETPVDAPWREALEGGIVEMARNLGKDPSEFLPETDLQTDIAALRERLAQDPKDFEGWLLMARAEAALGDLEAARAAIAKVRSLYPNAPFVQQQITQLEAQLGLVENTGPGPNAEDIEAAQEMSPEQQLAMIDSMVGGLANRLEQNPDDIEGWLMLVRSYSVLGRKDEAQDAIDQARNHYADDADASAQLSGVAQRFGLN